MVLNRSMAAVAGVPEMEVREKVSAGMVLRKSIAIVAGGQVMELW